MVCWKLGRLFTQMPHLGGGFSIKERKHPLPLLSMGKDYGNRINNLFEPNKKSGGISKAVALFSSAQIVSK